MLLLLTQLGDFQSFSPENEWICTKIDVFFINILGFAL